jgi:hypothetical protein
MPDLNVMANEYIKNKINNASASIDFIKSMGMGLESRPGGLKNFIKLFLGNSRHLWLWDYESTIAELEKAGFKNIRKCKYNDSEVAEFKLVEDESRFNNSISLEMTR